MKAKAPALVLTIALLAATVALAGPAAIEYSSKDAKEMITPQPTCDFSWTGFYVGARIGGGWSGDTGFHAEGLPNDASDPFHIDPGNQELDPGGFVAGGELGFNWVFAQHFMIGIATDISGSDISDSSTREHFVPEVPIFGADVPLHAQQDVDWFGTLRLRFGFVPVCKLLVYGTGGFAYGVVDQSVSFDLRPAGGFSSYPAHRSSTETGFTIGAGIEYALTNHWTIKGEYLYVDLGSQGATGNPNPANPPFRTHYEWDTQFHTFTAGVNYKF